MQTSSLSVPLKLGNSVHFQQCVWLPFWKSSVSADEETPTVKYFPICTLITTISEFSVTYDRSLEQSQWMPRKHICVSLHSSWNSQSLHKGCPWGQYKIQWKMLTLEILFFVWHFTTPFTILHNLFAIHFATYQKLHFYLISCQLFYSSGTTDIGKF